MMSIQQTRPEATTTSGDLTTALVLLFATAAALFAWLTPNHYPPWVSFHGEAAMGFTLILTGGWVLWKAQALPGVAPWFVLVTLAVALLPWMQLAGGVLTYVGDAWLVSLYLLGFAFAQWVAYRAVG